MAAALEGIDVAILAGGLGTRVSHILGDTPKVLAPIRDKTFLDHLLGALSSLGARHTVLCLGFLAEKVEQHLRDNPPPLPTSWVVESQPLGTAGAVAMAREKLQSDPILVLNGDTWLEADFGGFVADFKRRRAQAGLLCVPVEDAGRYGAVDISADGSVRAFTEKGNVGPGWINAGAMLLSQRLLGDVPARGSLERDVLARLPGRDLTGYKAPSARFIDIGTPETLADMESVIGEHHA